MPVFDTTTGLQALVKQPWEEKPFNMDFSDDLGAGETIASVSAVVIANQGRVAQSAAVTTGQVTPSGAKVQVWLLGGTDGENYKVSVRAITSTAAKVEGDGMLWVRD